METQKKKTLNTFKLDQIFRKKFTSLKGYDFLKNPISNFEKQNNLKVDDLYRLVILEMNNYNFMERKYDRFFIISSSISFIEFFMKKSIEKLCVRHLNYDLSNTFLFIDKIVNNISFFISIVKNKIFKKICLFSNLDSKNFQAIGINNVIIDKGVSKNLITFHFVD